jgi:hypothetical protein
VLSGLLGSASLFPNPSSPLYVLCNQLITLSITRNIDGYSSSFRNLEVIDSIMPYTVEYVHNILLLF